MPHDRKTLPLNGARLPKKSTLRNPPALKRSTKSPSKPAELKSVKSPGAKRARGASRLAEPKPARSARAARTKTSKRDRHVVSVIIPTIGRASLEQSKAALERQTRPADEIVIVVDSDRRGPGWALNEGIRRSRGDLITFAPDDGEAEETWLESLVDAIDRFGADCAGGALVQSDPLLNEVRLLRPYPDATQIDATHAVSDGANIMFRRAWLDACVEQDGFVYDESFTIGEDQELIWRMRRRGLKVVYVPTKMVHLRRTTPMEYLLYQFYRGVAISKLFRLQRKAGPGSAFQKSLIWGQPGTKHGARWIAAFLHKAIGPFNRKHFSRASYFWTHWFAEKFQSAGFLWGLLTR